MRHEDTPLDVARRVPARALRVYAEALGWKRVPNINGGIAVYHRPDSNAHQVIVPLDEQFDDYGDRVVEAVRRLAEFEKRPAGEVLSHLLLPPADVLRFREVSEDAQAGNLPLDHAVRLINGTRKVLLSVAHSVLAPQPYHRRMSRSEAEGFVTRCRLGPIELGSFTLTVACPLDLPAALFGPSGEPFARQVTSLLMQSLYELSQAVETARIDILADPARHPEISANFCESLLMLRPTGERAYLDVSATWSRAFLPQTHEPPRAVQLSQEVFEVAEVVGPRLRSVPQPRVDRFFGFVDELRGQPAPYDPRPSGEVRFTLFDQDEEIHAKADLTVDAYAEAGTAHLASEPVTFKGILHRLPRLNRVDQVTDFGRVRIENATSTERSSQS